VQILVDKVANVRWETRDREIRTTHNQYVDDLVREFQAMADRAKLLGRCACVLPCTLNVDAFPHTLVRERIPAGALHELWLHALRRCLDFFVEGFSLAKKCTAEGRGMMLLDFRDFIMAAERLSGISPVPQIDYVRKYIESYYMTEAEMEAFIKAREYSPRQLSALVNVAMCTASNKTFRQHLLQLIAEAEPRRALNM
jgi:hypothetical protein